MVNALLIANFGGPRHLNEIEPFLQALLTDQEVIRTPFPKWLHHLIFSRSAKKRAKFIAADYAKIGGKSPIFEDTEAIRSALFKMLDIPIFSFHRYLPETHREFIEKINRCSASEIYVFPLFPQFTYVTSGSIAKWFQENLPQKVVSKMRWIKSYPAHPLYVSCCEKLIREFLIKQKLKEEETLLFFSAHGLPKEFILTGDIYENECRLSFESIATRFSKIKKILAFQSQFGKEEWIRPYTKEVCENILSYNQGCKNVVFFPLSFPSDHIETLFEIEEIYLPLVKKHNLNAFRCPALNLRNDWIQAIKDMILEEENLCENQLLVRKK